jgi:hypothetical protein
VRDDLGVHDLTGGNTWVPRVIAKIYGTDLDTLALHESAARAELMLQKSAILGVIAEPEGDSLRVEVTVTNRTGHKLPTGYPEGRRLWLNVQGYDGASQLTYESGAYDPAAGLLTLDEDIVVYETKPGLSPGLASSLGLLAGPSFHFVLNDTIYKDNRIPPLGFTNAGFDAFGGAPVDSEWSGSGPRYEDGQNWDTSVYRVPPGTETIVTTLYYQTISREYVEFLRDENVTDTAGQTLYDLWTENGRAAPVVMARDTSGVVVSVPGEVAGWTDPPLQVSGPNPFRGALELRLDLRTPAEVRMEVFDVQGRRIADLGFGRLGGGAHKLGWDGRDGSGRDAGTGFLFVRVHAGTRSVVQRMVRVR